jgi:hypothetical protein
MPTFRVKHVVLGHSIDVYEVEASTEADAVAAVDDEVFRDQLTPVEEGEFVATDGWFEADDGN